jgi:hypothetical protein
MRRSGIAVLLGAMTVLCAYRPPPSAAQLPKVCQALSIYKAKDFVDQRVHVLAASFDFKNNGGSNLPNGTYSHPTSSNTPLPGPIATDLQNAFQLAPDYLKAELCLHTTKENQVAQVEIYIDPSPPSPKAPFAWSFWEEPADNQGDLYGRFIGISESLWTDNTFPQNLEGLERFILEKLLKVSPPGGLHPSLSDVVASVAVSGVPGTVSDRALLLVAVLGREMGLIINRDRVQPYADTLRVPKICNGQTIPFRGYSWNPTLAKKILTGDIHHLGTERMASDHKQNRYVMPGMLRRQLHLTTPNYSSIATNISTVYGTEWADLLAEATPTDDFAETYRLMVLRDAIHDQGGVLEITVKFTSGQPANMIQNLGNGTLASKAICAR